MLPKILQGVRGQPLSKCHAGLRAPPHHSGFIDVEVPCPRSTTKWSFAILDQALTVAVRFLGHSAPKQLFDLRVDGELLGGQPHLAVFIVKDQKPGCEPARLRKLDDLQNFLARRSPNDGTEDHVELCTFSQYVELPSQHVKDLAGCRVPLHPIDAETHIGHATIVESVNNLLGEEEPIRRHHAAPEPQDAHGGEDSEEIGMKGWLATHEGDGPGAKVAELLEPLPQDVKGNGFGGFVVFCAIAAGKIASPGDDHLRQERSIAEPIQPGD
jgi:hypothetical protein